MSLGACCLLFVWGILPFFIGSLWEPRYIYVNIRNIQTTGLNINKSDIHWISLLLINSAPLVISTSLDHGERSWKSEQFPDHSGQCIDTRTVTLFALYRQQMVYCLPLTTSSWVFWNCSNFILTLWVHDRTFKSSFTCPRMQLTNNRLVTNLSIEKVSPVSCRHDMEMGKGRPLNFRRWQWRRFLETKLFSRKLFFLLGWCLSPLPDLPSNRVSYSRIEWEKIHRCTRESNLRASALVYALRLLLWRFMETKQKLSKLSWDKKFSSLGNTRNLRPTHWLPPLPSLS